MSLSATEKDKAAEPAPSVDSSASVSAAPAEPVSLRPGGGFSFRPGGGFGRPAAASKPEPPKEAPRTDAKPSDASSGPVVTGQYGKFSASSRPAIGEGRVADSSAPRPDDVEEKPAEPEPDTFTNEEKRFYHPTYLVKFREHYVQPTDELHEAFKDVPDIDKSNLPTSVFFPDGATGGGRFATADEGPRRGRGFPSGAATGVVSAGGAGFASSRPLSSLYATAQPAAAAAAPAATPAAAAPAASALDLATPTTDGAAPTEPAVVAADSSFSSGGFTLANMYGSLGPVSASSLSGAYNQRKGQQQQRQRATPQSEQLRTSVNPWSLSSGIVKDEKDRVARQITSTLNKLTLDNFGSLSKKLTEIIAGITEPGIYEEAVYLVYDKSISEPNFSHMYAELCTKLNQVSEKQVLKDPTVTFRKVILNRCQSEFEKIATKAPVKAEEPAVPASPDAEELVAARKVKERRQRTGNIKFIGELFKSQLLSEKIVHHCIKDLLEAILQKTREAKDKVDRESLENDSELLCKLLTTTGKMLDIPKAKNYIDKYFGFLNQYQKDEVNFSPRVRFMIRDVIELRARNWVPRRDENAPKTIEEVHLEALRKDLEDAALSDMSYQEDMPRQEPIQIIRPDRTAGPTKGSGRPTPEPARASPPVTAAAAAKGPAKKKREPVTADKVDEVFSALVEEFLTAADVREAVDALKALNAAAYFDKFVETAVNVTLDRSDADRELVGRLLAALSSEKVLTADQALKGFRAIVAVLDDLVIDIPAAVDLVTKILKRAIADNVVPRDKVAALDKRFASL